jgi:hypothetical protein
MAATLCATVVRDDGGGQDSVLACIPSLSNPVQLCLFWPVIMRQGWSSENMG